MKKLKLSLANIEGAEVLSREQLKKVMGGVSGSGGGDACSSSPCKIAVPQSGGGYKEYSGYCAGIRTEIGTPYGSAFNVECWCYTDRSLEPVPLKDNQKSKCWNY